MIPTSVLAAPSDAHEFVRVCCHCRRTWTGQGWGCTSNPSGAAVTHGICRDCYVTHYPEFPLPPNLR